MLADTKGITGQILIPLYRTKKAEGSCMYTAARPITIIVKIFIIQGVGGVLFMG